MAFLLFFVAFSWNEFTVPETAGATTVVLNDQEQPKPSPYPYPYPYPYPTLPKEQPCTKEDTRYEVAKTEYSKSCGYFSVSDSNCQKLIDSCQKCPTGDPEDSDEGCVHIPTLKGSNKKAQCPQLAGEALKKAREDLKDTEPALKDLEEKVSEIKDKISEKQGQLSDAKSELEQDKSQFQADLHKEREKLNENLKRNTQTIDRETQEVLDALNKKIATSLKARHTIENLISKSYRDHRIAKNKIFQFCKREAGEQLSFYRERRRKAISSGRMPRLTITQLMNKNRVSLAQKDNARFKHYYNMCLKNSKTELQTVDLKLKDELKMIQQQKDQYLDELKRLQTQALSQTQSATTQKQKLVASYSQNVRQILVQFKSKEQNSISKFQRDSARLSQEIANQQQRLQSTIGKFQEKKRTLMFNRELIAHLEEKGVKDTNREDKFHTLVEAQNNFDKARKNLLFAGGYTFIDNHWKLTDDIKCPQGIKSRLQEWAESTTKRGSVKYGTSTGTK